MQMRAALLAAVVLVGAAASVSCASAKPPSSWQAGGARLDLPGAQWTFKGEHVVIRTHFDYAEVLLDNDVVMVLDRVGRIYDRYQRPIGVLLGDGRILGKDDKPLGIVGSSYAALPNQANAWLGINPQGQITKYTREGAPTAAGQWIGCSYTPFSQQACLLVSYFLFYETEGDDALKEFGMTPVPGMMPAPMTTPMPTQ